MGELPLNQIICGDCAEVLQGFPENSVDLVVTSPPYWGLRDYGVETMRVWGGLPECEHEWGESLPATKSGHKNIGFEDRSQQNYRGGGHKTVTIAEKHFPSEAGQFCSKCGAWSGSLGLEPHPQMFIDHFVEICREIKRVLKPSGTFWLNLGDSYASMKGKCYNPGGGVTSLPQNAFKELTRDQNPNIMLKSDGGWLQPKQKLMIPSRVAIALQHDGWILRNDICWYKPNHMPSSVKDRLTNAYEHIFLFVKNNETIYWVDRFTGQLTSSKPRQYYVHDETGEKRFDRPIKGVNIDWFNEQGIAKFKYAWQGHDYYFDLDAIRIPHTYPETFGKRPDRGKTGDELYTMAAGKRSGHPLGKNPGDVLSGSKYIEQDHPHSIRVKGGHTGDYTHPKGKNPGDLWRIPTTPFPGAHFATFPPKLIEPIIKAGSPQWICSLCGKPRIRMTEPSLEYSKKIGKSVHDHKDDLKRGMRYDKVCNAEYVTVGWSDCGCEADWVGGVVLDPFAGSGTALRVARRLGRRFIGVEINQEYAEMCERRVRSDAYQPPPEGVQPLTEIFENE